MLGLVPPDDPAGYGECFVRLPQAAPQLIAHYEVKLDHPGRDYERGRIWKISFAKSAKDAKSAKEFNLSDRDAKGLIGALDDPNLTKAE